MTCGRVDYVTAAPVVKLKPSSNFFRSDSFLAWLMFILLKLLDGCSRFLRLRSVPEPSMVEIWFLRSFLEFWALQATPARGMRFSVVGEFDSYSIISVEKSFEVVKFLTSPKDAVESLGFSCFGLPLIQGCSRACSGVMRSAASRTKHFCTKSKWLNTDVVVVSETYLQEVNEVIRLAAELSF